MQFGHTRGSALVSRGSALDSQGCSMQFGLRRSVAAKPAIPLSRPICRTSTRRLMRAAFQSSMGDLETAALEAKHTGKLCEVSND